MICTNQRDLRETKRFLQIPQISADKKQRQKRKQIWLKKYHRIKNRIKNRILIR